MPESYIATGMERPWQTYTLGEGRELKVHVLLGGIPDGPEAVHSIHPVGKTFPHFHLGAQFQLVLSGAIDFPDQHLEAPAVHYTDHSVPYGPFTTSLNYQMMVVHARPAGQIDMSDREGRKRRNPHGREIGRSATEVAWEPFPGPAGGRRKRLINEPGGLGAEVIEAPAGAALQFATAPYGQFQIILEGSAACEGRDLPQFGLRFVRG